MKEQLTLFVFFVGIGTVFGCILGTTSSMVVYNPKSQPFIGWLKLVGVVVLTCVIMPGNDVIINSLFGLGTTPVNWGNWVIIICLTVATVATFKSTSEGKKARTR